MKDKVYIDWDSSELAPELVRKGTKGAVAYTRTSDKRIAKLEAALIVMVDHEVDYMERNCLGYPEKQQRIIQARKALKGGDA